MFEMGTKAFERFYDSKMTVEVNKPVKEGNITKQKWVEVYKDEKCRISKKSLSPTSDGNAPEVNYQLVLYCSPSFDVPAGSRINVTDRHGSTRAYKQSSEPFSSYATHQEILLVRSETA